MGATLILRSLAPPSSTVGSASVVTSLAPVGEPWPACLHRDRPTTLALIASPSTLNPTTPLPAMVLRLTSCHRRVSNRGIHDRSALRSLADPSVRGPASRRRHPRASCPPAGSEATRPPIAAEVDTVLWSTHSSADFRSPSPLIRLPLAIVLQSGNAGHKRA